MTQQWGNEPFSSHSLPGSDSSEEQLCSKGLTCNKTNVVTQHKGIYMRVTQTPLENSTEKKPPKFLLQFQNTLMAVWGGLVT